MVINSFFLYDSSSSLSSASPAYCTRLCTSTNAGPSSSSYMYRTIRFTGRELDILVQILKRHQSSRNKSLIFSFTSLQLNSSQKDLSFEYTFHSYLPEMKISPDFLHLILPNCLPLSTNFLHLIPSDCFFVGIWTFWFLPLILQSLSFHYLLHQTSLAILAMEWYQTQF